VGCVDNALGYTTYDSAGNFSTNSKLTPTGRILRNLIHGADTVMSHITHFYHLAALDYIDASHLNHPAKPSIGARDMLQGTNGAGAALVGSYVAALTARRKAHTMGAYLSGRHPMQNAIVPGGVTTLLDATHGTPAITNFIGLLKDVREFINGTYIPDVLTVAAVYGKAAGSAPANNLQNYFTFGVGPGNLLSYGDFDIDGAGTLLIKRGRVHLSNAAGHLSTGPYAFDHTRIVEYVGYSHYENYSAFETAAVQQTDVSGNQVRHPWDGATKPKFNKAIGGGYSSYSWMKAPRYLADGSEGVAAKTPIVYEVGPLARMVVSYISSVANVDRFKPGANTSPTANDTGGTTVNLGIGTAYTLATLVNAVLDAAAGAHGLAQVALLWSVLGRHACRAVEAKFLADAMYDWAVDIRDNRIGQQVYTHIATPKTLTKGVGLVEAPRGALGHWIKIEKKRVLKYQCVVPSTWNISPRDDAGNLGVSEYTVANATLGNGTGNLQNILIDMMRILHTWDYCSACAIHVTSPDKKLLAIVHMDTDGSTKVEYPE